MNIETMQENVFLLPDKDKAMIFDREQIYHKELRAQPYQIFRVTKEGRWVETLARNCAPDPNQDNDDRKLFAIIEGAPYDVEIRCVGRSEMLFGIDADSGLVYYYSLYANGIEVGHCQLEEY